MLPKEEPALLTKVKAMIRRRPPFRGWMSRSVKRNKPPGGKLGTIIRCLEASEAASLHDLITLTGWQRATVHSALSRLRARGYAITMRKENGAPTYRLERR